MFRTKLQETYEVLDCAFYDEGTTGTLFNEWVNQNGGAISSSFYEADNTGVTFKDETGSWRYFMANRTGTSKTDVNDYSEPVVVEFDVVEWTSTGAYIQHKTTTRTASALGITGECKFKAVYDGSTIKYYVDDEEVTSLNLNLGTFRIGFVCKDGYIKFKNFKIYSI